MPATREQVEKLFLDHKDGYVTREIRGQGRRVARRIRLLDPASICEHFMSTAVGQLHIDNGSTVVAQNPDGLHVAYVF